MDVAGDEQGRVVERFAVELELPVRRGPKSLCGPLYPQMNLPR